MENHDYLWTTGKNDWVLVNSEYGYGIINKKTKSMLMVSDPKLKKSLVDKMLSEVCKVYSSIDAAYNDI